jgi:site-specific recombinase XerC
MPASVPRAGSWSSLRPTSATRTRAYRAACHFFAWAEQHEIGELAVIEPIHVAAYIEVLQTTAAKPTVKLHLAAIRMLFDWLVVGQVLAVNPAHAVRGPKHVVRRGKTPVLTEDQARRLLGSVKVARKITLPDGAEAEEPWLVGLRDRALMAVMTYSFARIGAVVAMRVEDYYPGGKRWWVRLHEKGGKRHEMPAHHKLEQFLDEYLAAAGIREESKTPLFRSAVGKTGVLMPIAWCAGARPRPASRSSSAATCSARPASPHISRPAERWRTPRPWPHTRAHARLSSTIAPATRSRSTRSSGLRFDTRKEAVNYAGPAARS